MSGGIEVKLSWPEITHLANDPGALQILANYNSYLETCADASDMHECAAFHEQRRLALQLEAEKISESYSQEIDPPKTHALAQPIETCPTDRKVLLYGGSYDGTTTRGWRTAVYSPELYDILQCKSLAPTHWMELPPNPI